jgi:hypothetical protein
MSPCKYKVYNNKPYVRKIRNTYTVPECAMLTSWRTPTAISGSSFFWKAPRGAPRQSAVNDGAW